MSGDSRLYNRALGLLARRSHSVHELRTKLRRAAPWSEVETVLEKLIAGGLLNDQSFALERARHLRERRRWGRRRIELDLIGRGVDAKIMFFVLGQLEEQGDERKALQHLIRNWTAVHGRPTQARQLRRLYQHCLRLGHNPEAIREELQEYFGSLDWEERKPREGRGRRRLRHTDDDIE